MKSNQDEEMRGKHNMQIEKTVRELTGIKHNNIHIIGIPKEGEAENGAESLLKT